MVLGRLGERLLPDGASSIAIEVRKENVENLRVPADWVTLDALLDVLQESHVSIYRWDESESPFSADLSRTYLRELEPVRRVVCWEDNLGGTCPTSRHGLLTQTADPEDLARHRQLTCHGNSRVEGMV